MEQTSPRCASKLTPFSGGEIACCQEPGHTDEHLYVAKNGEEQSYTVKWYQEGSEDQLRTKPKYRQLLFAVNSKFPNETRHETALRYIREAEERSSGAVESNAHTGEPSGLTNAMNLNYLFSEER